jgi:Fe-S-cluster containining protein
MMVGDGGKNTVLDETTGRRRREPPCLQYDCADLCCKYGVDVRLDEYANLIANHLAVPGEFTGPEEDEDGVLVFRTVEGIRGCVFLSTVRGCRLHNTPFKPIVCRLFPRNEAEALEAYGDGYLPCISHYVHLEEQHEYKSPIE